MSNPVMTRLESTAERTPAGYPTMPGYTPGHAQAPAGGQAVPPTVDMNQFERTYAAPDADAVDRGQVTLDDIVVRTGLLFGLVVVAAAATWFAVAVSPGAGMALTFGGMILGLILGITNAVKRQVSVPLILVYALAQGAFLGGISALTEVRFPGIVTQAVIATVAVFAVTLLMYKMRIVRNSARMTKIVLMGLVGLLVYYGASMLLQLTGLIATPLGSLTIMGIPLGIIVGLLAVALAVMSLIGDFDIAERCVAAGMPRDVAWRCSFGIIVTLVWLYVEILRLLQYVRAFSD